MGFLIGIASKFFHIHPATAGTKTFLAGLAGIGASLVAVATAVQGNDTNIIDYVHACIPALIGLCAIFHRDGLMKFVKSLDDKLPKQMILIFALIGISLLAARPASAGDKFEGFNYFMKPIPSKYIISMSAPTATIKKSLTVPVEVDSIIKVFRSGVWLFKPQIALSLWSIDKDGNYNPFSATGAGISFQREVPVSGNTITFEADADLLAINAVKGTGYGPGLFVGAYGFCVGGIYDVKNKAGYVATNFNYTIAK